MYYFIPTLVLMQCYGSIFHSKRMQAMRRATKSATNLSKYASQNGISTAPGASHNKMQNQDFSAESTNSSCQPNSIKPYSTAKLLFGSSLANPNKHLGILQLKVNFSAVQICTKCKCTKASLLRSKWCTIKARSQRAYINSIIFRIHDISFFRRATLVFWPTRPSWLIGNSITTWPDPWLHCHWALSSWWHRGH